jgi:hypothetical protein
VQLVSCDSRDAASTGSRKAAGARGGESRDNIHAFHGTIATRKPHREKANRENIK